MFLLYLEFSQPAPGPMIIKQGHAYALPVSRKAINKGNIPLLLDVEKRPEDGILVIAKLITD